MTDQEYMQKALIEAKQAFEEGEVPVGAVIVCRDRIIARAHNLTSGLPTLRLMQKCRRSQLQPTR